MNYIKEYENGKIDLSTLQEHLWGIGEKESLEIGGTRLSFYLSLNEDGLFNVKEMDPHWEDSNGL